MKLNLVTKIIIPISPSSPEAFLDQCQQALKATADMVELRLDLSLAAGADGHALLAAISDMPLAVLVTCRHQAEGGAWEGDESARRAYFQAADEQGAALIDYELMAVDALAWQPQYAGLILSYHDFHGPGTHLKQQIDAMYAAGADIAKVAITARDAADLAPLAQLCQEFSDHGIITIAMGEYGAPSRLLAGAWGCSHTFARLSDDDDGSAPGQPTIAELLHEYHLRRQCTDTLIFGVIGHPIGHSLSPAIHNAAFTHDDIDAVYIPFLVNDAESFWRACHGWIDGLSITIPHKQALFHLTSSNEPLAELIGAINTLYRNEEGEVIGANTDAQAALECVAAVHGDINGSHSLVLGAGGVSRGLCYALRDAGAKITITNRSPERAEALAKELQVNWCPWDEAHTIPYDVLINATSVGMREDTSPWPEAAHREGSAVFDTVYTPLETRLLREGEMSNCRCQDGLRMFIRQAAGQYERWLDQSAPELIMRRTALERLEQKE